MEICTNLKITILNFLLKNCQDVCMLRSYTLRTSLTHSRPIGRYLRLWTQDNKAHRSTSEDCIISSHGAQRTVSGGKAKYFRVPHGMSLAFYGPEGESLIANLEATAIGRGIAYQTIRSNELCRDYSLTRFQGKQHGSESESYEYIKELMDITGQMQAMRESGWQEDQIEIYRRGATCMDVVTVRNRYMHPVVYLSSVLKTMREEGYHYKTVYCSFCRVPSDDGDSAPTYDAKYKSLADAINERVWTTHL